MDDTKKQQIDYVGKNALIDILEEFKNRIVDKYNEKFERIEEITNLKPVLYDTPQFLTDAQKAQARANIGKYDWHTFNVGVVINYAVDASTIDYGIAQDINNVSGIDGYSALEAIMGWCLGVGFYANHMPDIDSVQGVFSNYEALVNGGATLSDSIILLSPEEEQVICRAYIGRTTKNNATHAIETFHRDYHTLLYYNINENVIIDWDSRYVGVSLNLETSGMAADSKVVGDKFNEFQKKIENAGAVKTINGNEPDENGNVQVDIYVPEKLSEFENDINISADKIVWKNTSYNVVYEGSGTISGGSGGIGIQGQDWGVALVEGNAYRITINDTTEEVIAKANQQSGFYLSGIGFEVPSGDYLFQVAQNKYDDGFSVFDANLNAGLIGQTLNIKLETLSESCTEVPEKAIPSTIARTGEVDDIKSKAEQNSGLLIGVMETQGDHSRRIGSLESYKADKATTLSGYGITDGATKAELSILQEDIIELKNNVETGGVSSWNDLLDKPFYEIVDENTQLIIEGDYTFSSAGGGRPAMFQAMYPNALLEVGEQYTVTIDSIAYPVVAEDSGNIGFTIDIGDSQIRIYNGSYYLEVYDVNYGTLSGKAIHLKIEKSSAFIQTIDEKFIPSSIARVEDIPESIQSDWNQNDEAAIDYIKNRPFYDGRKIEEYIYQWDGNIDGKETIVLYNAIYAKVSDDVFPVSIYEDDYIDKQFWINFVETGELQATPSGYVLEQIKGKLYFFETEFTAAVVALDNVEYEGVSYSKGVYLVSDKWGLYTSKFRVVVETGELKKLDKKYLPNIALKSDIDDMNNVIDNINSNINNINNSKMNKENPTGTGSFSLNRKNGSVVGDYSTVLGNGIEAIGRSSFACGEYNKEKYTYKDNYSEYTSYSANYLKSGNYYYSKEFTFNEDTGIYTLVNPSIRSVNSNYTLKGIGAGNYFVIDNNDIIPAETISGNKLYGVIEDYDVGGGHLYSTKFENHNTNYYKIAHVSQHVSSRFSEKNIRGKYAYMLGNGTSDTERSNAHTVDWEGNAWYAGSVEGTSIILSSPNGTKFSITVGDDGVLSASEITE